MMRTTLALTSLFLGALGALAGCQGDGTDVKKDDVADTRLSYYRDIKPVMERYCTGCHKPGEVAPFSLTDYDAVSRHAAVIKNAVNAERMPPWQPSDASLPMRYSRKMRAADKKLLLDWLDAGALAGDTATAPRTDIPAAESAPAPRPDLTLAAPRPYTPNTTENDDYHCFVFDPQVTSDRYLVGGQVKVDNSTILHHMALFLISPAQAAQVRMMNASGDGYTCFGGPGKNISGTLVMGWAPGGTNMRTPAGTAFKIPKGSVLVMQTHYNLLAYKAGETDHSQVVLEMTDDKPQHELMTLIMAQTRLSIKAGDPESHQTLEAPISVIAPRLGIPSGELTAYQTFPHMHLLGKRISLSVPDGPTIIDIPRWDFHWQDTFTFSQPITLRPSDSLKLECVFDNSAANQPPVNGQQPTPKDVTWGEGTGDEMCVSLLLVTAK